MSKPKSKAAPGRHQSELFWVFGYVRVSTDKQETERQEQTIAERHKTLPDGLDKLPLKLFYDEGISAWSDKPRPGFEEMRTLIAAGQGAAVIVDTSSRLTRQGIRGALEFRWELDDAGCRLFTTKGSKEYSLDLIGILNLILDAEGDERFSSNLSHNIATGKSAKARAGRWHHGDTSPGYKFDRERDELIATSDLQYITEAFRRFADGHSYKSICAYLTENLSESALNRRKNSRGDVSHQRLHWMLKNPVYLGKIVHRDELYEGSHPPAVDVVTFERVQRRLEQLATSLNREPRSWPFTGIAKCGHCHCGLRLHPIQKKGRKTPYLYVRCNDAECARQHKAMTAAAVEGNVIGALAAVAHVVEAILTADVSYGISTSNGAPSLEEANVALETTTARLKQLGELIADGALDKDNPKYLAALQERDDALNAIDRAAGATRNYRDELATLAARVLSLGDNVELNRWTLRMIRDEPTAIDLATGRDVLGTRTLPLVLAGWQAADFEQRRELIAQTLEAAYIKPDDLELHFRTALPQPLVTHTLIALHGHDAELEQAGYGRPVVPAQEVCGSDNRLLPPSIPANLCFALNHAIAEAEVALRQVDFGRAA